MLLTKRFSLFLFSSALLFFASGAGAASCCGGGFALPSIITGDDAAQLTATYSYSKIDADVFADGIWQKRSSNDRSQNYKIEGSHIFYDRYQAGLSVPVQTRERGGEQGGSSTGVGDVAGSLGYEYLPDWDYNPWRPHGIGFLSLTLPTGKSIYEFDDASGLDSNGRGFWALGLGTVLTKSWFAWDANSSFEIHRSFDKAVRNSQVQGTAKPGYGGSFSLGAGYNIKDLRIGGALAWSYEDPIGFAGSLSSPGAVSRYTTASLSLSYMLDQEWAGTLSYSDQTLFGSPVNTTLSKSVALLFQKRWAR